MSEKAKVVAGQAPKNPYALIAHSLGALVAALGMRDEGVSPARLVLVEPALYDLARGAPAIEAHIGSMSRARTKALSGDLFGYWQIVRPLMFGAEATTEDWPDNEPFAKRFARIEPPWGHYLDTTVVDSVPTLVVTGGWSDEYETIARTLATAGAARTVLVGNGHRAQDHPQFNSVVESFLDSNGVQEHA